VVTEVIDEDDGRCIELDPSLSGMAESKEE
jgi:hypothetical protein